MTLYTIEIRSPGSTTSPIEIVCAHESLAKITYILDKAEPYTVFEYKISSAGGGVYSKNSFPFLCEKLVHKFDWSKDYVPPKFEFLDDLDT